MKVKLSSIDIKRFKEKGLTLAQIAVIRDRLWLAAFDELKFQKKLVEDNFRGKK